MTPLAQIRGQRMGGGFVGSISACVTCRTTIGGLAVIKWQNGGQPNAGFMAGFAQITRDGVVIGFAGSRALAIVTPTVSTRLSRYRTVIKQQVQPITGFVAYIARLGSRNVINPFTDG
jgi:hypothetical protein